MTDREIIHRLAREINDREKTITDWRARSDESATGYAREAILQGQSLIKLADSLPVDISLDTWLPAHCTRVEVKHAHGYMRLAKNPTRYRDPHQMLLAIVVDRPKKNNEEKYQQDEWQPWYRALSSISKWMRALTNKAPIDSWPESGKQRLRDLLLPIVKSLWPHSGVS